MRHHTPESISSLGSANSDDASVRHFSDTSVTPPSTAPQSSSSSFKSASHPFDDKERGLSSKPNLKPSRSGTALRVRFSVPEPSPAMPRLDMNVRPLQHEGRSSSPESAPGSGSRASLEILSGPPARMRIQKRFSAPAPVSRRKSSSHTTPSLPPSPNDPNVYSKAVGRLGPSRITSFHSIASAPASLQSPPSPSQPPSQYQSLQHYVPCQAEGCKAHYTSSLLGLTFYSPQEPHQLIRKRGLCPSHARKDIQTANQRAKQTWESMRQNCGRKTLGAIAAEFELYLQHLRDERAEDSKLMERSQKQTVLGVTPTAPAKSKDTAKGKEPMKAEEEVKSLNSEVAWRYSPRPCTNKECSKQWYCPFDNRLYFFYTTERPSGLLPLTTLCPACAKADVERVEERIEERHKDLGDVASPEWETWCDQVERDREMEIEFWEKAQEKQVLEKMASQPLVISVEKEEVVVKERRRKRDICIVM